MLSCSLIGFLGVFQPVCLKTPHTKRFKTVHVKRFSQITKKLREIKTVFLFGFFFGGLFCVRSSKTQQTYFPRKKNLTNI
jgi:hypothetical protein